MGKLFELSNQQKIEIIETRYLTRTELEGYKALIDTYRFLRSDFGTNSVYTYNHYFCLRYHNSSGNTMLFAPVIVFNAEPKIEAGKKFSIKGASFFALDDNLALYIDEEKWLSIFNIAQIYEKSLLKELLDYWTSRLFDDSDEAPSRDELVSEYSKMLIKSAKSGVVFTDFRNFEQGDIPYIEIDDYKTLVKYIPAKGDIDIVIPEGVEAIRNEAFFLNHEEKVAIRSIHLPASVRFIEDGTFWDMYDLESITVSPENIAFENIDGALYGKGWDNVTEWIKTETNSSPQALICYPPAKKDTKEYVFPAYRRKTVTCGAFSNCQLETITINAEKGQYTSTNISDYAFRGCSKLNKISFGNAKEIFLTGVHHFEGCSLGLNVNFGNKTTLLTPNGLISKNQKTIYYAIPDSNQEWHIPEGVEGSVRHIANWNLGALQRYRLKKIYFPKSFLDINDYAFNGLESVEEIYLSENTKNVRLNGFLNCRNLKHFEAPNAEALCSYSLNGCPFLETVVLGPNCEFDTYGWPDTVVVEAPAGSQTIENAKRKGIKYKEL